MKEKGRKKKFLNKEKTKGKMKEGKIFSFFFFFLFERRKEEENNLFPFPLFFLSHFLVLLFPFPFPFFPLSSSFSSFLFPFFKQEKKEKLIFLLSSFLPLSFFEMGKREYFCFLFLFFLREGKREENEK